MPRGFSGDEDGGGRRRINLPRPPALARRETNVPRPAASPNRASAGRQRAGEVPTISKSPSHTGKAKPFVGADGRTTGVLPQPPKAQVVETETQKMPDGGTKVRERLEGERVADEFKQDKARKAMQAETEMAPAGTTKEPPPSKTSPLGAESPIEQLSQNEPDLPAGRNHHLREIGIGEGNLPPDQQKIQEAQTVRDFSRFGSYEGEDDPEAPPPPIRPGKNSYNPATAQWVKPEGQVSMLDRLGKISKRSGMTQQTRLG